MMFIRIEGESEVIQVKEPELAEEVAASVCAYMFVDVQVVDDTGKLHHEFFSTKKVVKEISEHTAQIWTASALDKVRH